MLRILSTTSLAHLRFLIISLNRELREAMKSAIRCDLNMYVGKWNRATTRKRYDNSSARTVVLLRSGFGLSWNFKTSFRLLWSSPSDGRIVGCSPFISTDRLSIGRGSPIERTFRITATLGHSGFVRSFSGFQCSGRAQWSLWTSTRSWAWTTRCTTYSTITWRIILCLKSVIGTEIYCSKKCKKMIVFYRILACPN